MGVNTQQPEGQVTSIQVLQSTSHGLGRGHDRSSSGDAVPRSRSRSGRRHAHHHRPIAVLALRKRRAQENQRGGLGRPSAAVRRWQCPVGPRVSEGSLDDVGESGSPSVMASLVESGPHGAGLGRDNPSIFHRCDSAWSLFVFRACACCRMHGHGSYVVQLGVVNRSLDSSSDTRSHILGDGETRGAASEGAKSPPRFRVLMGRLGLGTQVSRIRGPRLIMGIPPRAPGPGRDRHDPWGRHAAWAVGSGHGQAAWSAAQVASDAVVQAGSSRRPGPAAVVEKRAPECS